MLVAMGWAWLGGAVVSIWIGLGLQLFREWTSLIALLPGIACLGLALFKWKRGWGALDMKKGAHAEETIGQAIEFALTRDSCAVAHHVEEIAKVGDIDHLVVTSRGLWVIETKHGRVPKTEFPEVLERIAHNVAGVRDWAPGMQVTGCLVFAREPAKPPQPIYKFGAEKIKCYAKPKLLMHALRDEARNEGGSSSIAQKVWRLAKVETA